MKTINVLLLLTLAFSAADAFTTPTKKKERRAAFQHPSVPKDSAFDHHPQEGYTSMFAFAPSTTPTTAQVVQYYEPEEEGEVPYSVALVSCMLSLAVGFGLGYGT
jgi:hypothetical protein